MNKLPQVVALARAWRFFSKTLAVYFIVMFLAGFVGIFTRAPVLFGHMLVPIKLFFQLLYACGYVVTTLFAVGFTMYVLHLSSVYLLSKRKKS